MLNSRICKATFMSFRLNWNRLKTNSWIRKSNNRITQELQWDWEVEGKSKRARRISKPHEAQLLTALAWVWVLQEQRGKRPCSARGFLLPLAPPQQQHLARVLGELDRAVERAHGGDSWEDVLKLQKKLIVLPVPPWNPFGMIHTTPSSAIC